MIRFTFGLIRVAACFAIAIINFLPGSPYLPSISCGEPGTGVGGLEAS
jgi:hypothetical protein